MLTPEVIENPVNNDRVFDASNNLDVAAALLTGFDIDPEHAFKTFWPPVTINALTHLPFTRKCPLRRKWFFSI